MRRVVESGKCPLTIVHAPAGYGKTTFLKQWYETQEKTDCSAAWLSLEDEENNLSLFLGYLAATLEKAGVSTDPLQRIVSHGLEEYGNLALAAVLIDSFQKFDRDLLVFLDDFQAVTSDDILDLIRKVVFHLPENVSIVLSSRVFPDLRIESLRTQGKVREISIQELRFSLREMESVLDRSVHEKELSRLWERTEGWPIACHMITLLRKGKLLEASQLHALSGRTTDLAAYITEQVFASLGEDEQTFLMYTAIVNRFTGDLANVLCGDMDSWGIWDALQREDLFIIALDTEGKWFRYHQLFREYLLERLHRHGIQAHIPLHLKAAQWYFDNDYISEAVEHALRGRHYRLAAGMVDNLGGWRLIYQDRLDWIMDVLDRLTKPIIEEFPRLFLAKLILLIKRGKPLDARMLVEEMREKTNGFDKWGGKTIDRNIRTEIDVVSELILGDYSDKHVAEASLSFARKQFTEVANDDHILKAMLHDYLSSAYIDAGMLDKAGSHINNAVIMYRDAGFYYGTIYVCYHRANVCIERAKLHDALDELEKAREIASQYLNTNANIRSSTCICMADIALMQNRISDANDLLGDTLDIVEMHDGWFDLYAKAYVTASRVAGLRSGPKSAIRVLDRARQTADERNLPRLRVLSDLSELKLLLLSGSTVKARQMADRIGLDGVVTKDPSPENLSVFLWERAMLAAARLHLMEGNSDAVSELLFPLAAKLNTQGRFRFLVEAWLLMARTAHARDDGAAAETFLDKAVHVAMFEEYKRPFLDEGSAFLKLCAFVKARSKRGSRYYRSFLADIDRAIKEECHAIDRRFEKFGITQREYYVIRELSKGLSNKEIASRLCVSEDTVKYRLKNIFRKWSLSSRHAAVRVAMDKGILQD